MEAKKITLKTLLVSCGAVLLTEVFLRPAVTALFVSPLPGTGITRLAQIILLILIAVQLEKRFEAIGLAPQKTITGIKKGLTWSACFAIAAIVLGVLLHMAGINAFRMLRTPLPDSTLLVLVYFVVGGFVGPVAEEIFFRGIVYGFCRQWGIVIAIALSTLFFVLPHMTGGNLPFTQIVGGLVFAIAYEKEKNLLVPITIHCLGNLAIFSITFL